MVEKVERSRVSKAVYIVPGVIALVFLAIAGFYHVRIQNLTPIVSTESGIASSFVYSDARRNLEDYENSRMLFSILAVTSFIGPIILFHFIHGVLAPFTNDIVRPAAKGAAFTAGKVTARTMKAVDRFAPPSSPIAHRNLSTADELRKWADLRAEGLISEEEFQKMRGAILGER